MKNTLMIMVIVIIAGTVVTAVAIAGLTEPQHQKTEFFYFEPNIYVMDTMTNIDITDDLKDKVLTSWFYSDSTKLVKMEPEYLYEKCVMNCDLNLSQVWQTDYSRPLYKVQSQNPEVWLSVALNSSSFYVEPTTFDKWNYPLEVGFLDLDGDNKKDWSFYLDLVNAKTYFEKNNGTNIAKVFIMIPIIQNEIGGWHQEE